MTKKSSYPQFGETPHKSVEWALLLVANGHDPMFGSDDRIDMYWLPTGDDLGPKCSKCKKVFPITSGRIQVLAACTG